MADEDTLVLLNNWGLAHLIESFKENGIDIQSMRLLKDSDLNELIKPIGMRVKFRENLVLWQRNLHEAEEQAHINNDTFVDVDSNTLIDISNRIIAATGGGENIQNQLTETSDIIIPDNNIISSNAFSCREKENSASNTLQFLDSNFVSKLLNESIDGKGLLAAGKHSGGLLNESQRRELGRLIIRALLERSPSIRIQSVSFTRLSLEINSIFPREPAPIYFTPSVSASKYSKKQNACGVLYEAYISRRRKLRAIGELAGTSRSRSSSLRSKSPSLSVSSVAENEESLNFEDNPILEEHLRWLETGVEPWTIVQLYWKDTASFRLKHLQHNRGTVSEYFNKYPSLKLNQGYRLLLEDFSLIQPEKENNLFSNIILLKESLLKIATEKRKTSRDVYYKQQLDMYVTTGSSSHADSSIGLLLLLPYILAAPTGRKVGGKLWRPSRVEVRDAFITHVPSDAEIIPTIEGRKNKYTSLGRTFQPLIIIVGSDLTTIVKSIVVVDNTFYTLPTPLQAVDAAFKIFHSTGACYPEEATDVWLLIQRAFYQFHTNFDRLSQSLKHVLTDLGIVI